MHTMKWYGIFGASSASLRDMLTAYPSALVKSNEVNAVFVYELSRLTHGGLKDALRRTVKLWQHRSTRAGARVLSLLDGRDVVPFIAGVDYTDNVFFVVAQLRAAMCSAV